MSDKNTVSKVMSVIATILIVVLAIIFLHNVIYIIMGANSETPPSMFGITPLVVLSGSMDGDEAGSFPAGSMVMLKKAKDVEVGDVIAFRDPGSKKGAIVTHRVTEVATDESGATVYYTQGDANNAADEIPIPNGNLVGEYWFHIPAIGKFVLFLKEPAGMLLCIGLPIFAFIGYDIVRGKLASKKKADKTAEMEAELERLRALAGERAQDAPAEEIPAEEKKPDSEG